MSAEQAQTLASAFSLSAPVRQVDLVFLRGDTTFATLVAGETVVRLRAQGGFTTLTAKSAARGTVAIEHETTVGDIREAASLLELMGWTPVTEVRKTRRTGHLDDVTVAIDEVDGLGHFLELELVVAEDSEVENALARLDAVRESLEVAESSLETRKYDSLLSLSEVVSSPRGDETSSRAD